VCILYKVGIRMVFIKIARIVKAVLRIRVNILDIIS